MNSIFISQVVQFSRGGKLSHLIWLNLLLTLCLWLTGCAGVRVELGTDVTFYENEKWAATQNLKFPPQLKPLLEQAEAQNPGKFEANLKKTESDYKAKGIEATVSHKYLADDSLLITITGQGQGLTLLKEIALSPQAELKLETVNGQRHINLRYTPLLEIQGMMVVTNTLRLTGGQIITSNANRVEGGTAIWENPRQVEVTLTEASGFSVWPLLGGVVACVGLGLATIFVVGGATGTFYWYRRRSAQG